jgi:flagellar motility protein MotE (MotC chaperone)
MTRHARRGKGTLHIIGGLLVLSGIVRAMGTGQAWAEAQVTHGADANPPVEVAAEPDAVAPTGALGDNPALLEAFRQREARIAEREKQMEDRMQALQLAEREASERVAALAAAEDSLKSTMALADVAAETDVQKLVAVYENMKPKEAAALFSQMTPDFAAGFLGLMNPLVAAQILAQVSPETAYSISVELAGRNAGVPKQ